MKQNKLTLIKRKMQVQKYNKNNKQKKQKKQRSTKIKKQNKKLIKKQICIIKKL